MKNVILTALFATLACMFASGEAYARPRTIDQVWKSSTIAGNEVVNTSFATAPVVIHNIIIASPTVNQNGESYVAILNSTSSVYIGQGSTVAMVATNSTPAMPLPPGTSVDFENKASSFTFINKVGGATIVIEWDWYTLGNTGLYPTEPTIQVSP